MKNEVKLFEQQKVRTHWDEENQQWYFSIIDVIEILTDSNNSRRYWSDLKRKLKQEGINQLYEFIVQLKLVSSDGKKYATDCTNTKNLLRIIQSSGVEKKDEFAFLTNIIHTEWAGVSVKQHKNIKGLKTQNLTTLPNTKI